MSKFLLHFWLEAELNRWTDREKGMYLGVSLSGSALKILETVDSSGSELGYYQLLEALEQRYQPVDQVALYQTQLRAKHQAPGELLGDFSNRGGEGGVVGPPECWGGNCG